MKITKIETLLWTDYPRLLFVRVHTDAGIVGIGETVDKTPGSRAALHGTVAPLLLGQNPLDIEGLWRFVFDNIMYHGYAGAELRALSAVEIALWDILGKVYGAPVYRLLGGKSRQRVPVYNTCIGHGDRMSDYQLWHDNDGRDAGQLARSLLDDGISAMKIWPFDPFSEATHGQRIRRADIERGLGAVRSIRNAVGHDMEIGIECHFRWNRASMERIARALEPYDILFLEDSLPAVLVGELGELSRRTSIPIIGSELLLTRWQLREWLERHTSQIIMTDPTWTGGINETRKIAALGETYGVPLVLHNAAGPVCHVAGLHIAAHIPNLYYLESVRAFYRTYFPILTTYHDVPDADGTFAVPDAPGLGIDFTEAALARDDLTRQVSEGAGIAAGRLTMGDHWEREDMR